MLGQWLKADLGCPGGSIGGLFFRGGLFFALGFVFVWFVWCSGGGGLFVLVFVVICALFFGCFCLLGSFRSKKN